MKILDDLISILNFTASVKDIRQGVFHTGVLTRHCGLAATLPRDALRQKQPMVNEPGCLLDKSARDLVQLAYSKRLLELCPSRAYVIIIGDTAPLSPILFDYGVDAVSGTKVVDVTLALRCVSEGANFRQIKGVKRLTMMR